jgi:hypothetical protein
VLQSAGAIGFSVSVTGGLAVVGTVVGLGSYGLYKHVTRDREIKIFVHKKKGESDYKIEFEHTSTIEDVLLKYLPVDISIPNNITEIGLFLYDIDKKQKAPFKYVKEQKAKDVNALLLMERDPTMDDDEMPYYLKRDGQDLWKIVKNSVTADW